jgi:hypothetical protein
LFERYNIFTETELIRHELYLQLYISKWYKGK